MLSRPATIALRAAPAALAAAITALLAALFVHGPGVMYRPIVYVPFLLFVAALIAASLWADSRPVSPRPPRRDYGD